MAKIIKSGEIKDRHKEIAAILVEGKDPSIFDDWGEPAARIWVRAGFQCEYCGKDFFDSPSTYKEGQLDHVLPQSQYTFLAKSKSPSVYALACQYCNLLKRDVDVGSKADAEILFGSKEGPENKDGIESEESENRRTVLVQRAKEYLASRRSTKQLKFEKYRSYVRSLFAGNVK